MERGPEALTRLLGPTHLQVLPWHLPWILRAKPVLLVPHPKGALPSPSWCSKGWSLLDEGMQSCCLLVLFYLPSVLPGETPTGNSCVGTPLKKLLENWVGPYGHQYTNSAYQDTPLWVSD